MERLYRPKPDPFFIPSKEDMAFAEAYAGLAKVLDAVTHSELVTLRLSTCRNAYMTVNALFEDLSEILGHGDSPSRLHRAIRCVEKGLFEDAIKIVKGIRFRLGQYGKKWDTWKEREDLDREFWDSVESQNDLLLKDRMRGILHPPLTREMDPPSAENDFWSRQWEELSSDEPSNATYWLELLRKHKGLIDSMTQVIVALVKLFRRKDRLGMFSDDQAAVEEDERLWGELYRDLFSQHRRNLKLRDPEREGEPLCWNIEGKGTYYIPLQLGNSGEAKEVLLKICEYFTQLEKECHKELSTEFRPNVSRTPLPAFYRVDLSDRHVAKPQGTKPTLPGKRVRVHKYNRTAPATISVTLGTFGVPSNYYNFGRHGRYADDTRRREVEKVAKAAIDAASSLKNSVLVLPEVFLPGSCVSSVVAHARDKNVVLISGVEPKLAIDPETGKERLYNQAVVALPSDPEALKQTKRRNSPYEIPFSYDDAFVHVFTGTEIGSFAVVVCSDLRELDTLVDITYAGFLVDTMFVCSYNPQTEFFKYLAISDSARLYCHVVIANSYSADQSDDATAEGSLVCSPMRDPSQCLVAAKQSLCLGLPRLGGVDPSVRVFEVPLHEVRHEKDRQMSKYVACPQSRRGMKYE